MRKDSVLTEKLNKIDIHLDRKMDYSNIQAIKFEKNGDTLKIKLLKSKWNYKFHLNEISFSQAVFKTVFIEGGDNHITLAQGELSLNNLHIECETLQIENECEIQLGALSIETSMLKNFSQSLKPKNFDIISNKRAGRFLNHGMIETECLSLRNAALESL